MSERETYYYIFRYVDGSKQEFERDTDELSSLILNPGRERVKIDNVIINLDKVIKVTIETEAQREEERRKADESYKETIEAFKGINF